MCNVGWSLEKCKEGSIRALLDDYGDDFTATVGEIESLKKLGQDISTVVFFLPRSNDCPFEHSKKVIDSLAHLLKQNSSIKNLKVITQYNDACLRARMCLLEALASGQAGDSLEYLWIDCYKGSIFTDQAELVVRYLRMNQNLSSLRMHMTGGPGYLQLVSSVPCTVTELCLELWPDHGMRELGAMLGQCSSILSLKIIVWRGGDFAESFFQGMDELSSITRLEVDSFCVISPLIIDAIESLVVQRGSLLEHFAISAPFQKRCYENWLGLGSALRSVKRVSLQIEPQEAALMVLPQLQSCESLELPCAHYPTSFPSIGSVVSSLPLLRGIVIGDIPDTKGGQDDVLHMIKSSASITNVHFESMTMVNATFQEKVDSFCALNRVFGTSLLGFGPIVWIRTLSKISDCSARATLLYRLLRGKPELIVGSMQSASDNSTEKRQRTSSAA